MSSIVFQVRDLPFGPFDRPVAPGPDEFFLLREVNHRFANTLALLAASFRRELGGMAAPDHREAFERYETRIVAFGDLHRALLPSGSRNLVSLQAYMDGLCRALSAALLEPFGIHCDVRIAAGELPSERCELLGLVVAELVTNAAKHAFRGRSGGIVRIALIETRGSIACSVADEGVGMPAAVPASGLKILERLVRALDGRMVVTSGRAGTSVLVTFEA